jgi:hypothetical protein
VPAVVPAQCAYDGRDGGVDMRVHLPDATGR